MFKIRQVKNDKSDTNCVGRSKTQLSKEWRKNGVPKQISSVQNNIQFFTSKNREIKAGVVERFNRTIKTKLWKHFTITRSYRYLDVIKQIANWYNKSYHRSIKMAPCQVNKGNESFVRERLYGVGTTPAGFKFKLGDNLRVNKIKGRFEKGYLPNWSEEIFSVSDRLAREPVMYRLFDYNKEAIEGLFYEN